MSQAIKQTIAIGVAIILVTSLSGCSLLPKEEEAMRPPLVKPAQENYTTVEVVTGAIEKGIHTSGRFESLKNDIAQFTGQGGQIKEILVHSGDQVKRGDVLVQLITDGLDLRVKEQQLSLERAKYAYEQAKHGEKQALKIAALQLEIEQIKYDRLAAQFNSKQLTAQIDGQVVFAESLMEGDFVEAYQTLVRIADPTSLQVVARIDNPSEIREVELGMDVSMTMNKETFTGKIVQTPSTSPTTLNKELAEKYAKSIYIEVPELPEGANIGSSVDVKIVTHHKDQVTKIPRSGLRSYLGRNFVRILEDGQRLREVDVEVGLMGATEVEIINGLEAGHLVVLQ